MPLAKHGAKLVHAVSTARVPKFTVVVGNSFGAGNYAMCGRAFDPFLTLAWPNARCAVMGAAQAANVLLQIDLAARKRRGEEVDEARVGAALLDDAPKVLERLVALAAREQPVHDPLARPQQLPQQVPQLLYWCHWPLQAVDHR